MSNRNALADVDLYEIFKLPVEAARAKAREIISQAPKSGQLTIVDRWRQLPDGRIELYDETNANRRLSVELMTGGQRLCTCESGTTKFASFKRDRRR